MTQDIEKRIIEDYLSKTMFIKDICKKYEISSYIFNKILKKYNIEKYNPRFMYPQNQRKFPVKDDYFSYESPNMAYILGFLAADGCIRKDLNEIKITLSAVDKELLEKIKKEIGGRDIKEYTTNTGFDIVEWHCTSKKIKEDLAKYNIVPNKTYSFVFPKHLNKDYWIDFIRGYFDGDGCISTAGPHAIKWQLCSATNDVLQIIVDFFFEKYEIPKVSIQQRKKDGLYYIQYSSTSARKIYDILYYQNCLCLKRKKEKYEAIYSLNLKK